jgi:phosphatidylglycerol:prolipoprotein diacylglycerol transferase
MFPKLFEIGDFFLPTYGLLVAAAFLTALWLVGRLARREGLNPEHVTNLAVYCAIAGLVGAKLLMFVFDWGYYTSNPGEIFSLSTLRAGGVFHGGLIAALVTAFLFMRSKNLPALKTADILAPGLALGHAIGRLGCFAAGCCWGVACERPWAVTFTDPEAHRLVGVPLNQPLHPTQLYESGAEAAIFGLLYWFFPKRRHDGQIIGLYLVLYSVARFLVEFLRHHQQANPFGGPFSSTQWIAFGLLIVGAYLLKRPSGISKT